MAPGPDPDYPADNNPYRMESGTSVSAPFVAGAAALLIQARPTIDPATLKDLLWQWADHTPNAAAGGTYDNDSALFPWNKSLGAGIINVYDAYTNLGTGSDVAFSNCDDSKPPDYPGGACNTIIGVSWNNSRDIKTVDPVSGVEIEPTKLVPIRITARIKHKTPGTGKATVLVNFAVHELAVGNRFYHIGTKRVEINTGEELTPYIDWVPQNSGHQCIQVTIQYGGDKNYSNNVTQRNLGVINVLSLEALPPHRKHRLIPIPEFKIENPLMVPAAIHIKAVSDSDSLKCSVGEKSAFMLNPWQDCPRKMNVAIERPEALVPGDESICDIGVYATPEGSNRPLLIGGVTMKIVVPKPCRMVGQVVDSKNFPVRKATLSVSLTPDAQEIRDPSLLEPTIDAVTDDDGMFSIALPASVNYTIRVEHPNIGQGVIHHRLNCGLLRHKLVLSREGVKLF
jgi:hypothetical protein